MLEIFYFSFFKRATFIVALFYSLISVGKTESKIIIQNKETYQDIIDKAHNLSLQKNRTQAIDLILGAIQKESKKGQAQRELVQALDQISKIFISDKAQQLYELGLSLKDSDQKLAMNRFNEALRLEPDNSAIEIAITHLQMISNDCGGALSRTAKFTHLFPYVEEWRLVNLQASICDGQLQNYIKMKNLLDLKGPFSVYWILLETEFHFVSEQYLKAQESLAKLMKMDMNMPELYYWSWKVSEKQKIHSEKYAQKYLSLCKTLNSRQRRAYSFEPFLCRRMTEVETFLKSNNNAE